VVDKCTTKAEEKLNDMIATLRAPDKPKGKAWSDLEAWWNQLNEKGPMEVIRGFRDPSAGDVDAWEVKDAREITRG